MSWATPTLAEAQVGDVVRFAGERMSFTVQARDERFVICTRPFAPRRTVLYSVVDLVEQVRGPDDHYSLGYETRDDCERALLEFQGKGDLAPETVEVSHRNRVPLEVVWVRRPATRGSR